MDILAEVAALATTHGVMASSKKAFNTNNSPGCSQHHREHKAQHNSSDMKLTDSCTLNPYVGTLIIRVGFWGILYYICNMEGSC